MSDTKESYRDYRLRMEELRIRLDPHQDLPLNINVVAEVGMIIFLLNQPVTSFTLTTEEAETFAREILALTQ